MEFDRVLPIPPHPPQQCVASSAVIYGAAPAVRGHLLRCMVTARERVLDVLLATHDVDGLCKELPARVTQLTLEGGGRLAK